MEIFIPSGPEAFVDLAQLSLAYRTEDVLRKNREFPSSHDTRQFKSLRYHLPLSESIDRVPLMFRNKSLRKAGLQNPSPPVHYHVTHGNKSEA